MNSNKIPYWKHRLHEIVYEADTRAGRRFDLILLILILLSVVLVMLESIAEINGMDHYWSLYSRIYHTTHSHQKTVELCV